MPQIKVSQSKTPPIFADEVMVSFVVKRDKEGKRKEGVVRLSFIDTMRKEVISDIVLTPVTAQALMKILENSLKKLDNALKGKLEKKEEEATTYIG